MNAASKKNMMSISGMISIRAFLIGTGELLCLLICILVSGGKVTSIPQRIEHQNDVVTRRFELELEPRHSGVEKVEENQSENRNPETASCRNKCFRYSAANLTEINRPAPGIFARQAICKAPAREG